MREAHGCHELAKAFELISIVEHTLALPPPKGTALGAKETKKGGPNGRPT
jgi:hypothetical protein